jgi:hypothetical protein
MEGRHASVSLTDCLPPFVRHRWPSATCQQRVMRSVDDAKGDTVRRIHIRQRGWVGGCVGGGQARTFGARCVNLTGVYRGTVCAPTVPYVPQRPLGSSCILRAVLPYPSCQAATPRTTQRSRYMNRPPHTGQGSWAFAEYPLVSEVYHTILIIHLSTVHAYLPYFFFLSAKCTLYITSGHVQWYGPRGIAPEWRAG